MVTINASTTSGLVMTSDLSGVLQFQQNGVALPNGGVAPAFSAYQSSAQALASNTNTKITYDTEEFDTNNNFASSRFTPTVAGYYQVSGGLSPGQFACGVLATVYKNGSVYKNLFSYQSTVTGNGGFGSTLVYLNGTTDYVELYGLLSTAQNLFTGIQLTYFNGCLVRGA